MIFSLTAKIIKKSLSEGRVFIKVSLMRVCEGYERCESCDECKECEGCEDFKLNFRLFLNDLNRSITASLFSANVYQW